MPTRHCGECTLCCRLLPTPEIDKPPLLRCPHQCSKGCRIYARRPMSCRLWSCQWLAEAHTVDLPRPDRAHYVIDSMPDYVTIRYDDGSPPQHVGVIQVWLDPAHPDAHRAPSFRRWLDQQGMPAMVRLNARDGFVLFPPSTTDGEGWVEKHSSMSEHEHTIEQKAAALGGSITIELSDDGGAAFKTTVQIGDKRHVLAAMQMDDAEAAAAALADARKMIRERQR